ncbi:MAG: hypothetical protein N2422_05210 [Rhodobacteraceae bacterium]|nr:hypothetical protein [Paracoccaceae bacterium]
MALRLCVIGNSHIAALKLGWAAAGPDGIAPVFFGAPADGLRHLRLEDGALVPRKAAVADHFRTISGGQDRIVLEEHDAFLLVGLNVSSKRILRFYRTHAWVGLNGTPGKTLVHPAFALAFMTERYAATRMAELAATIAGAAGRPVIAVAEPHWAAWARTAPAGTADYGWDAAASAGDGEAIGALFAEAVAAALAPHAVFVAQPAETVEHGIMTRAEFNREASRLIGGEGGGTDASHMNGDYGAALWPLIGRALQDRLH